MTKISVFFSFFLATAACFPAIELLKGSEDGHAVHNMAVGSLFRCEPRVSDSRVFVLI